MGKINFIKVNLAKENALYMAGKKLTGCLDIQVNEKIKINSIFLHLRFFSNVRWYFKFFKQLENK